MLRLLCETLSRCLKWADPQAYSFVSLVIQIFSMSQLWQTNYVWSQLIWHRCTFITWCNFCSICTKVKSIVIIEHFFFETQLILGRPTCCSRYRSSIKTNRWVVAQVDIVYSYVRLSVYANGSNKRQSIHSNRKANYHLLPLATVTSWSMLEQQ